MEFCAYSVGQVISGFIGKPEAPVFDVTDTGATMVVLFNKPKESEIEQFRQNNKFEIRFTELYGVIMITVKIGDLEWMDMPYSPHLSKNLTKISIPSDGLGLSLFLMLVDTSTGMIKNMRLIGLSENFSKKFLGAVMEQKMKPFDRYVYDATISKIYSSYSTKEIVKISKEYYKINS